jgi:hypothetical protein
MGSWSNSLHVKCDDARAVARSIEQLLLARGYTLSTAPVKSQVGQGWMARQDEALVAEYFGKQGAGKTDNGAATSAAGFGTNGDGDAKGPWLGGKEIKAGRFDDDGFYSDDFDDEFDEDLDVDEFDDDDDDGFEPVRFRAFGGEPEARAVSIFEPRAGWVAVMDSSLEGNVELAQQLSAHLSTDTMLVLVNDSDSWYYSLHRNGLAFDEFDSSGGEFDEDGAEPTGEWLEAMENEDEEKLHELLMSKAPQNIKFPDPSIGLPFQLAILGAKIQTGQATFWERLKYRWLSLKFLWKLLTGRFTPEAMDYGFDIPHPEMDDDTIRRHIERIKALFPNANEKELRELLPKCRFPSEDLLRQFLQIVGLPSFYAYLCYTYLEEHSERELASHGIVQATELHFDPPGGAA